MCCSGRGSDGDNVLHRELHVTVLIIIFGSSRDSGTRLAYDYHAKGRIGDVCTYASS